MLGLQKLPVPVIALLVSIIMATITELLSNAATTTLILPVLAQLVREGSCLKSPNFCISYWFSVVHANILSM